jgi:broad specificity phosphatase PhoE
MWLKRQRAQATPEFHFLCTVNYVIVKKMKKNVIFSIIFLFFLTSILQASTLPDEEKSLTIIFLVRHAEKAQDGNSDPPLTSRGKARAQELAYILKHVPLEAVYSTPSKRTQQTALPTAEAHNLQVNSYKPGEEESFLKNILSKHAGENVLIIGHSNTVPVLANHLSGSTQFPPLDESTYDNIFIASVPQKGHTVITRLRFGEHTSELSKDRKSKTS